jgi:hypothetical protein
LSAEDYQGFIPVAGVGGGEFLRQFIRKPSSAIYTESTAVAQVAEIGDPQLGTGGGAGQGK